MDFSSFQSAPPPNAYQELILVMQKQGFSQAVLEANGSDIANRFPPYFRSFSAMELAAAYAFNNLSPTVPRIRFLNQNAPPPPPLIVSAMQDRVISTAIANTEWMLALELERAKRDDMGLTEWHLLSQDPAMIRLQQFMTTNLNQHHRRAQAAAGIPMLAILQSAITALNRFCNPHNFQWSLRPHVAQSGNQESNLRAMSVTRGLQNPHFYMSASNIQADLFFKQMNLNVITPLNWSDEGPAALEEYNWWIDSSFSAAIRVDEYNHIALMPAGLPPQLALPVRARLPLYITTAIPISSVHDQAVFITQADFSENEIVDPLLTLDISTVETQAAARVLVIIAALSSLVLTPLTWGKGHRKPSWIQSPPNSFLINHLLLTAQYQISILNGLTL